MRTTLAVGRLVAGALAAAPQAGAGPDDLTPYCSGGQVPTAGECRPQPGGIHTDDAPGPDPRVPMDLDPGAVPAV